jgi:hypothetical protein
VLVDDVVFFFTVPLADLVRNQQGEPRRSVLAMARQEILDCLVGDWRSSEKNVAARPSDYHRLYASAMVIFAAIDLLAKFHAGDAKGGVAQRFLTFVHEFMGLSEADAEAVYAVRNSMMHSFGLYDNKNERGLSFSQGCIRLDEAASPVWSVKGGWIICLHHLYNAFLRAVHSYEQAVIHDSLLQENFENIYHDYGYVIVIPDLFSRLMHDE